MSRHVSRHPSPARTGPWLVVLSVLVVIAALAMFVAFRGSASDDVAGPSSKPSSGEVATQSPAPATQTPPPTTTPPPPTEVSFSILAGGDVLPHGPVHTSARSGDGYDFRPLLAGVTPWVAEADLALCHMEVPLTPDGQQISGYPMFAASPDLVQGLADEGWDGCSTASNHSVDRKFAGVAKTLDVFDEVGLGHAGTARSKDESNSPQIFRMTIDGVETVVAHLSATYGLNGLPMPAEQPWAVQLIDVDRLTDLAKAARADGADLILVSVHAGNEYQTSPTEEQLTVAQGLADSGEVDMMIGHHAHVPQPMTKLDGGPDGRGMWVAYGLGNMLSNQDTQCCVAATNSGLLLSAQVDHVEGEPAQISSLHWIGITVDRLDGHKMHAFADILDAPNGVGKLSGAEIKARYTRVAEAVGSEIPELTAPVPAQKRAELEIVPRNR